MSLKTLLISLSVLLMNAPSLFASSEVKKTLDCGLNQQPIRLCSANNPSNEMTSASLILCENKQPHSAYIKLVQTFKNDSRNELTTSGTLTPDPNNNLTFISWHSNNLIKVYFTNDHDEAYLDITSITSGESSMTLYCN